jgi:hypothetical protein
MALLLDVDRFVRAFELAEFLGSVVEVLLHAAQPLLQKNALAVRR